MKLILCSLLAVFTVTVTASADVYVPGYTTQKGTNVAPHFQSSPNGTVQDNFSYKGNQNPYTGAIGTNKYPSSPSSGYYDGSSKKK